MQGFPRCDMLLMGAIKALLSSTQEKEILLWKSPCQAEHVGYLIYFLIRKRLSLKGQASLEMD